MEVLKSIYTILSGTSSVTDLLGGANSLQPTRAKKPVNYPVVVYRVVGITPYDTKSSASTIDRVEVRFHIAAKQISQCADIETELRLTLDRYQRGTVAGVQLDGVRFLDSYLNEWNDDNDVQELVSEYYFRVKRDPDYDGPLNQVPEELFVERLETEDFSVSSGRSITLSAFPAEVLLVVRGKSQIIDYTVNDKVITMPSSDPAFGEYTSPEAVRVVYIRNYSS